MSNRLFETNRTLSRHIYVIFIKQNLIWTCKNVFISTVPTGTVTVVIFVTFLWELPMYWYPRPRIRYASFQHISHNTFSCISLYSTFYSTWKITTGKKKSCHWFLHYPASVPSAKLYTRKELVMMETYIDDFHTSF